jgi:hypothetical protein
MKNRILFGVASLIFLGYAILTMSSCHEDEIAPLGLKLGGEEEITTSSSTLTNNSLIVAPNAIPYGKTLQQWTIEWSQYVMSFECSINPLLDETGEDALNSQYGPVVFLASTIGGTATREVTIAKDKLVLFPVINVINDYPCPDALFKPAKGQSVESFLIEGARNAIDQAQNLQVTLDGVPIKITKANRYATRIFHFTGSKDLVNCLDPCITGFTQPAVSDGYWIMLNKLRPGQHKLHFHGEIPSVGYVVDVTYLLIVK